jgi:8-oxo-dGTP pyrophosphatase MutT (NUDIX family)
MECKCNSCFFDITPYVDDRHKIYKGSRSKAGAVIFDEKSNVVLVQSRGNLWGFPKGSLEDGESPITGAIREVSEETGIQLKPNQLREKIKVNRSTYFQVIIKHVPLSVQQFPDNDVNAIAWIKPSCLEYMVNSCKMNLNSHAKQICKKTLNLSIN